MNKKPCFSPHLFHQILDLPQVSIYTCSVERCLSFLIPLVPLKSGRRTQEKQEFRQ